MKAALILADGAVFEGQAFGAEGRASGLAVFFTGVVGYQEVVTDPAYRGAIVALTYPMIGSYGVNGEDSESDAARAAGVVIRDYCPHYSNFRATGDFEGFLRERGIPGISGVDTRALAVHIRENGEMPAAIVSGDIKPSHVAKELKKSPPETAAPEGPSLNICAGPGGRAFVLMDIGAPASVLSQLRESGLDIGDTVDGIDGALSEGAAGLIALGGGIDPGEAPASAAAIEAALGEIPVLGIGAGHEVLALALGCGVTRMKTGHHGLNHSVRELESGRCVITAQHHSFVVEADVPADVEVTHTNVNDGTVEGIRCRKRAARGVQFRPGRDETGAPNAIFRSFLEAEYA